MCVFWYTQGLDGFQVVREELITSKCLVENLSKIEQLSLRRRQESKIVLHVERTDCTYRCPHCGGIHTHAYKLRDRTVNGVPDAFIPVLIRFTVHRLYCPDSGETWVEKIPFLSKPTSRSTRQLEKTIVALRGDMSIKALSATLGLSRGRVKKVEKDYLAKKYAHIPLKGVKALTKNHENLTEVEKDHLNEIRATFGELADVYAVKEMLRGIYSFTESAWAAELLLDDWCATARKTEVPELLSMAKCIEEHKEGILGYWRFGKACNSGAEGFNTKIRWLLKQAFGYRDREYLRLKIYALPDTQTNREL